MRAVQVSAREQAAREVAIALDAYLKARDDLDAAHDDYLVASEELAALKDLADMQAAEDDADA
jgi:hypothetical protein